MVGIWTIVVPAPVIQMNVTNTATNTTVPCIATCGGYTLANLTVQPNSFYPGPGGEDPTWCSCLTEVKGSAYNDNYYTYTNILLDPVSRILAIDQTWYCDDEDARKP